MKAALLVSAAVLASSAYAQSNSTNAYIPSGISSGCSSFLYTLNSDSTLQACTNSLLTPLSAFTSGSNSNGTSLTSTLDSLCTNNQCSNSATRMQLTNFYTQCQDELNVDTGNDAVILLYDVLYTFLAFRAAVCTTDTTTGNYCVSNLASTTPASKRDDSAPVVDPSSMTASGVQFLYMLPSSSASQLCTSCGAAVLGAYATWEAATPYGTGLTNSPMLGSQSALWSAVQSKCGSSFVDAITSGSNISPLAALGTGGGSNGAASTGAPVLSGLLGLAGLISALMM